MRHRVKYFLAALVLPCSGFIFATTDMNGGYNVLGQWYAGNALTTQPCKMGVLADRPAICSLGECYFVVDGHTGGGDLYWCWFGNAWQSVAGPHALLSLQHTDTLAASPVEGDLIIANSTPAWTRLPAGASTATLHGGTTPSWAAIDLGTAQVTGTLPGASVGDGLTIDGGLATTTHVVGADIIQTMRHATDCTAITDGLSGEICYEQDSNRLFVCEPTAGGCDTPGEWIETGGGGGAPAFSAITGGTNTAALVIGGGGTLGTSGTGTITANTIASSAGAAPTVSGTIAYDSTANTLEYGADGTNQVIPRGFLGNTGTAVPSSAGALTLLGGNAIVSTAFASNISFSFDATATSNLTWNAGASSTWTWNASGSSDPKMVFTGGSIAMDGSGDGTAELVVSTTTVSAPRRLAFPAATPTTLSVNTDNYDPGDATFIRLSASPAAVNITGFANGTDGRQLQVFNVGGFNITLVHESTASLLANRITSPSAGNIVIPANNSQILVYDGTTARWRPMFRPGPLSSGSHLPEITAEGFLDSAPFTVDGSSGLLPTTDYAQNLGAANNRYRTVYATEISPGDNSLGGPLDLTIGTATSTGDDQVRMRFESGVDLAQIQLDSVSRLNLGDHPIASDSYVTLQTPDLDGTYTDRFTISGGTDQATATFSATTVDLGANEILNAGAIHTTGDGFVLGGDGAMTWAGSAPLRFTTGTMTIDSADGASDILVLQSAESPLVTVSRTGEIVAPSFVGPLTGNATTAGNGITTDSHTAVVVYSDDTNTTHDTGDLVCAISGRTCVSAYSLTGVAGACNVDRNTGVAVAFQAACR
jgi:hypothetical protein